MRDRPLLLGHRGARKYAPENTIAAFGLALEHGCDGFEFDVRLTADRVAVICHDAKLRRMEVAAVSYAKLVERCGEVTLLKDVLARFHRRAFLNVELKVAGAEETVLALLREYPPEKGRVVSSFLPEVVVRWHELGARLELGLICENRRQLKRLRELPVASVMLERKLVKEFVKESNSPLKPNNGLNGAPTTSERPKVFVWTVNGAREMKMFAEMGVDGIISDDTKGLVEAVGRDLTPSLSNEVKFRKANTEVTEKQRSQN